ncbi:MAG: NAD(+)/NADH kinase [Anaerolineae bacterium]|nr:NAD(+)/NADH kinase [Anaerolineae bacterium]MCB0222548.1 NAD(+)/NADH kinase [Anaerolineae bacterium]MCB9106414.1 NAD(+)/NADH kinase [Anaerolineales bacterium]
MSRSVGIIANPASGKDIRRLVAHGSVFDNNEKINIIRRVLLGLDALGIEQVLAMPDISGLARQAAEKANVSFPVALLDMPLKNSAVDSTWAAAMMAEAGVGCIVTLGGDGTNRAVAKGCGYVPLVPISTGTNNAFPVMVEGTLAGLAAAVVAQRIPGVREAGIRLARRLDVYRNGELIDFALVDVVAYAERFVASGAIWDPHKIRTVVLAHPRPGTIGASAIGGYLPQAAVNGKAGMWLELGDGGKRVLAPIAPGLITELSVKSYRTLKVGEQGVITIAPSVLALDGEREIPIKPDQRIEVRLSQNGPHVVDVTAALQAAGQKGVFIRANHI